MTEIDRRGRASLDDADAAIRRVVRRWPSKRAQTWSLDFVRMLQDQPEVVAIVAVGSAVRDVGSSEDVDLVSSMTNVDHRSPSRPWTWTSACMIARQSRISWARATTTSDGRSASAGSCSIAPATGGPSAIAGKTACLFHRRTKRANAAHAPAPSAANSPPPVIRMPPPSSCSPRSPTAREPACSTPASTRNHGLNWRTNCVKSGRSRWPAAWPARSSAGAASAAPRLRRSLPPQTPSPPRPPASVPAPAAAGSSCSRPRSRSGRN